MNINELKLNDLRFVNSNFPIDKIGYPQSFISSKNLEKRDWMLLLDVIVSIDKGCTTWTLKYLCKYEMCLTCVYEISWLQTHLDKFLSIPLRIRET